MREVIFEVLENRPLTPAVFQMTLRGDTGGITAPGQFVNIRVEGLFLRRPISVCDYDAHTLTLVYKVVGKGTAALAGLTPGARLDLLTGLGNGYDLSPAGERPLLLGGGVGVPPLYRLCKDLLDQNARPAVILGFNTREEVFYEEEFRRLRAEVTVTTADGSYGTKGFVTDALEGLSYTYFYTCGPEPMLRAVHAACHTSGQFSFEERMGCGFGACMGCSCQTVAGPKRICKEGPVLRKEEILW